MTRGRTKQFDREEVLERAMDLFWAQGYEATGMSDLLGEMRIGRQSLYDTFGDKRTLFLAALEHYVKTRLSTVVAILRAPGSPVGNLKKVFEHWRELDDETEHSGCLVGNSVGELARRDEDVARILAEYLDFMENEFYALLQRAKKAKEIDPPLPLRDLSRTMLAMFQGMALLTKIDPDQKRPPSLFRSALTLIGAS